jgi:hypothetical protein
MVPGAFDPRQNARGGSFKQVGGWRTNLHEIGLLQAQAHHDLTFWAAEAEESAARLARTMRRFEVLHSLAGHKARLNDARRAQALADAVANVRQQMQSVCDSLVLLRALVVAPADTERLVG